MSEHSFKPSELKFLWKKRGNQNYKFRQFLGGDRFPKLILFHDVAKNREVLGKMVDAPAEGEAYHWARLHHDNILPLYDVVSINEHARIFITPVLERSLRDVIHDPGFLRDPRCFDRKKAYVEDVLWALDYVHQKSLSIVNLNDTKILICGAFDKAVIGDFSGLMHVQRVNRLSFELPPAYRAPELEQEIGGEFNPIAAAMWACGVMIMQIFTQHMLPWATSAVDVSNLVSEAAWNAETGAVRQANIGACLQPEDMSGLKNLLAGFLKLDPNSRTSAGVAALSEFLQCSSNKQEKRAKAYRCSFECKLKPTETTLMETPEFNNIAIQRPITHDLSKRDYTNKFINLDNVNTSLKSHSCIDEDYVSIWYNNSSAKANDSDKVQRKLNSSERGDNDCNESRNKSIWYNSSFAKANDVGKMQRKLNSSEGSANDCNESRNKFIWYNSSFAKANDVVKMQRRLNSSERDAKDCNESRNESIWYNNCFAKANDMSKMQRKLNSLERGASDCNESSNESSLVENLLEGTMSSRDKSITTIDKRSPKTDECIVSELLHISNQSDTFCCENLNHADADIKDMLKNELQSEKICEQSIPSEEAEATSSSETLSPIFSSCDSKSSSESLDGPFEACPCRKVLRCLEGALESTLKNDKPSEHFNVCPCKSSVESSLDGSFNTCPCRSSEESLDGPLNACQYKSSVESYEGPFEACECTKVFSSDKVIGRALEVDKADEYFNKRENDGLDTTKSESQVYIKPPEKRSKFNYTVLRIRSKSDNHENIKYGSECYFDRKQNVLIKSFSDNFCMNVPPDLEKCPFTESPLVTEAFQDESLDTQCTVSKLSAVSGCSTGLDDLGDHLPLLKYTPEQRLQWNRTNSLKGIFEQCNCDKFNGIFLDYAGKKSSPLTKDLCYKRQASYKNAISNRFETSEGDIQHVSSIDDAGDNLKKSTESSLDLFLQKIVNVEDDQVEDAKQKESEKYQMEKSRGRHESIDNGGEYREKIEPEEKNINVSSLGFGSPGFKKRKPPKNPATERIKDKNNGNSHGSVVTRTSLTKVESILDSSIEVSMEIPLCSAVKARKSLGFKRTTKVDKKTKKGPVCFSENLPSFAATDRTSLELTKVDTKNKKKCPVDSLENPPSTASADRKSLGLTKLDKKNKIQSPVDSLENPPSSAATDRTSLELTKVDQKHKKKSHLYSLENSSSAVADGKSLGLTKVDKKNKKKGPVDFLKNPSSSAVADRNSMRLTKVDKKKDKQKGTFCSWIHRLCPGSETDERCSD